MPYVPGIIPPFKKGIFCWDITQLKQTMANANGVETEVQSAPIEQAVESNDLSAAEDQIDYEAEFKRVTEQNAQVIDELDRVSQEKENYKRGMLKAKGKLDDDEEETPQVDIAKLVAEQVQLEVSKMKGTFTKNSVQNILGDLSNDPAEQKLIQWHYDNSLIKSGTTPENVREDLEKAKMLANAPKIMQKQKELQVALKNKAQVSSIPLGSGIPEAAPQPTAYFSPAQIAEFKEKGWDDAKIQRAAANLKRSQDRPR